MPASIATTAINTNKQRLKYPMISPASVIPAPAIAEADWRILLRATCPKMMASRLPIIGRMVIERMPQMRLATAAPEVPRDPDISSPTLDLVRSRVPQRADRMAGPDGGGGVRPGKESSGTHWAAPGVQARSVGNSLPVASCCRTCSREKGPDCWPLRAIWMSMREPANQATAQLSSACSGNPARSSQKSRIICGHILVIRLI